MTPKGDRGLYSSMITARGGGASKVIGLMLFPAGAARPMEEWLRSSRLPAAAKVSGVPWWEAMALDGAGREWTMLGAST